MSQSSLFDGTPSWRTFNLPGAEVALLEGFISEQLSFDLYERIRRDTPWRQDNITVYGKTHPVPRLQQWFGENGLHHHEAPRDVVGALNIRQIGREDTMSPTPGLIAPQVRFVHPSKYPGKSQVVPAEPRQVAQRP